MKKVLTVPCFMCSGSDETVDERIPKQTETLVVFGITRQKKSGSAQSIGSDDVFAKLASQRGGRQDPHSLREPCKKID